MDDFVGVAEGAPGASAVGEDEVCVVGGDWFSAPGSPESVTKTVSGGVHRHMRGG